jgi:signal transduction histidine kinase
LTKKTKNEISAVIGDLTARDTDYIVEAFERLKTDFKKLVKTERTAAISETAVTVNHEINNPLTAILGNTQLLLMGREKLSGDVVAKLETIEKSAIQIRETTAKLMSIIEPVKSSYSTGMDMIDIEKSKKKKSS